jgi:murein DD-endopeptidase MepM/ murein hydrolase activator NlpD
MRILAITLAVLAGAPWTWPVDGPHDVVRPFIVPAHEYGPGHRGVDLPAPDGVLLAPADGVVHFAGVVVDRPVLSIDHGGGVLSSYEPVSTSLSKGDVVTRGQAVGTVLAGHCSMTCVHLGVRIDGEYVSPMRFLGVIPRAVLLPTRELESVAERLPSRGRLVAQDADRPGSDAEFAGVVRHAGEPTGRPP